MGKNNFNWETEAQRLKRHMSISPKKKLEWLYQINQFVEKCSTPQGRKIRRALRDQRSLGVTGLDL